MLRRVISPPLRGRYPLHQQYRDCELPAAQGSPMNCGHFPSDEAVIKLLWLAICDTCGQASPRTRQGERTASIQAQGQGQARRRTDHHRLEQGPGPAHHRLPRPNQPLPIDPAYTENWTGPQPGPRGTGSHPIHDQPGVSTTRPDYRTEPQSPRLSLVISTQSQILSTTFTPITPPRKRVGASCRTAREARGPWWAWEVGCRCRPGPRSRESTPGCTPGRRRRTRDGSLMRSAQSLAGVGTTCADAWWPQPSAHRVAESRRSAGLEPAGTPTTP